MTETLIWNMPHRYSAAPEDARTAAAAHCETRPVGILPTGRQCTDLRLTVQRELQCHNKRFLVNFLAHLCPTFRVGQFVVDLQEGG